MTSTTKPLSNNMVQEDLQLENRVLEYRFVQERDFETDVLKVRLGAICQTRDGEREFYAATPVWHKIEEGERAPMLLEAGMRADVLYPKDEELYKLKDEVLLLKEKYAQSEKMLENALCLIEASKQVTP